MHFCLKHFVCLIMLNRLMHNSTRKHFFKIFLSVITPFHKSITIDQCYRKTIYHRVFKNIIFKMSMLNQILFFSFLPLFKKSHVYIHVIKKGTDMGLILDIGNIKGHITTFIDTNKSNMSNSAKTI